MPSPSPANASRKRKQPVGAPLICKLGLPDHARVTLRDGVVGEVDSIDKLLEVDEGNTLDVSSDVPGTPFAAAAAGGHAKGGPRARCSLGDAGPSSPGVAHELRLDMDAADADADEGGDQKYRKRRLVSLSRTQPAAICLGVLIVGATLLVMRGLG